MSLLNTVANWGRLLKGPRRRAKSAAEHLHICRFELMEPRQMLSANPQIHFGSVFFDPSPGKDTSANTIQVTFQGGQPNTQLTQLIINGSKNEQSLATGDIVWNTNNAPVTVVSSNGFQVLSETATNGGSQIVLTFSGFVAGDELVLSAAADKVTAVNGNNVTTAPLTKGNDFQGSHLVGTFTAPHYENVSIDTAYVAGYNALFAQNDATVGNTLNLPPQNYEPPSNTDQSNQTTGASVLLSQTPLPISIGGTVYDDANQNNVQDAGEPGVAGVTVTLDQFNGTSYVTTGETATTDANGDYLFQFLLPGTYQVVETVPSNYFAVGAQPGSVNNVTQGTAASATDITSVGLLGGDDSVHNNFGLAQAASLSGSVVDCLADQPLSGVTVNLLNGEGTILESTTTNAQGNYEFSDLMPDQTYGVAEVLPSGYMNHVAAAGSVGGSVAADQNSITQVTLGDGVAATGYTFCDVLPASISGSVVDCFAEQPLSGVTVNLLDGNGNILKTTTTNAQGAYSFGGLLPGQTYGVAEVLPAGYMNHETTAGTAGGTVSGDDDSITGVSLGDGVQATGYVFCDVKPASISGSVVDCLADQPLSNVTVNLLDANGNIVKTTTTNSQGAYQFTNLLPDQVYGVQQILPAGYLDHDAAAGSAGGTVAADFNSITQVSLGEGVNATAYNFCDVLPASLSGSVVDCLADQPLSGVTVNLLDSNGNILKTTTTNAQGAYSFSGLMPGETYGVDEVLPAGYMNHAASAGSAGGTVAGDDNSITQVNLGDGVQATSYVFCDVLPASISGSVVDCSLDQPLSGVTVNLLDSNGKIVQTTTTNDQGNYQFTGLLPGETYGVSEVLPTGYLNHEADAGSAGGTVAGDNNSITQVSLADGVAATDYDFCDEKPVSISGFVEVDKTGNPPDPSDTPLGGVTINLLDDSFNVVATTTTAGDGSYSFAGNLLPGDYVIQSVTPNGYYAEAADPGSLGGQALGFDTIGEVTLVSGDKGTDYDFFVEPPSTISGIVFQDGPAIDLPPGVTLTPDQVPLYRSGVFQPGDKPIAGVTLFLGNADGQLILDNNLQPITATTDANGFYEFTNLAPGSYTVLQDPPQQPNVVQGLSTAGTTGGIPLNPNTVLSPSIITQLAISISSDAIIQIPLGIGVQSANNNFSVVVTQTQTIPPPPPPPPPPVTPPVNVVPVTEFVAVTQPVSFVESTFPQVPQFYAYSAGGAPVEYTWHLSVIDGGQPRESGADGLADANGLPVGLAGYAANSWMGVDLTRGQWVVNQGNGDPNLMYVFGTPGAIPVQGDFLGDGRTRMGVFIDGEWFIDANGDGKWDEGDLYCKLGSPGDTPVVGDWDGDGKDDIGVYGPAWPNDATPLAREPGLPVPHNDRTGVKKNMPPKPEEAAEQKRSMQLGTNGKLRADVVDHVFRFGQPGDIPVVGDWTGSGVRTIGVFHDGVWKLDIHGTGKWEAGDIEAHFGQPGDVPVVGDWDGSGKDSIGVYRNGTWILDTNHNFQQDAEDEVRHLGEAGDTPVVGHFNGGAKAQVGVYRNGTVQQLNNGPAK